jgi:cytoskeleton-associated protein 5
LYDFKQQHPEANIDRFLRKSSQFFQDYVEAGLQRIDEDRRKTGGEVVHPVPAAASLMAPSSMNSLGMSLYHTSYCVQLFHTSNP